MTGQVVLYVKFMQMHAIQVDIKDKKQPMLGSYFIKNTHIAPRVPSMLGFIKRYTHTKQRRHAYLYTYTYVILSLIPVGDMFLLYMDYELVSDCQPMSTILINSMWLTKFNQAIFKKTQKTPKNPVEFYCCGLVFMSRIPGRKSSKTYPLTLA